MQIFSTSPNTVCVCTRPPLHGWRVHHTHTQSSYTSQVRAAQPSPTPWAPEFPLPLLPPVVQGFITPCIPLSCVLALSGCMADDAFPSLPHLYSDIPHFPSGRDRKSPSRTATAETRFIPTLIASRCPSGFTRPAYFRSPRKGGGKICK